MDFSVTRKENYCILTVGTARLDSHAVPQFNSELVLLSGEQVKNVIIDFAACEYCDAAGLSCIMIAHRLFSQGRLILSGVHDSVERMISIQRFDPPLELAADLQRAEEMMATPKQ